jgi:high-affinity K+ transport system ATPase subunit B
MAEAADAEAELRGQAKAATLREAASRWRQLAAKIATHEQAFGSFSSPEIRSLRLH